jgi:hypothetical protein
VKDRELPILSVALKRNKGGGQEPSSLLKKKTKDLSQSTSGLLRSVQQSIVRRKSMAPESQSLEPHEPAPLSPPSSQPISQEGNTRADSGQRGEKLTEKKPQGFNWVFLVVFLVICLMAEMAASASSK